MEQIKKLSDSVQTLQETVDAILKSTDLAEISKLDAKIGATLHSIQYGTGVCAIAIKRAVDERRRDVRSGVVKEVVTNNIVVEEPKVEEPKEEAPKKKRGRKSKKASK